ncbi:putative Transcription factor domain-containing protein [Seiridium cardinale]|uniref:Transcription factor domain-containing protein n=1 Tax=Seiridium cardinale TaxID=138064 RepID=A0ABR2Y2I5_9PEZI
MANLEPLNLVQESLEWHDLDINLDDLLSQQPNNETTRDTLSASSSLVLQATPSADPTAQSPQDYLFRTVSIPRPPADNSRSLVQRPKTKTGMQSTASLILHTLKSFSLMILHHNTLPPFIHPSLVCSDVGNDDMESLNNCISLMHMASSGVQGSLKLFWKNVRQECERLYDVRLQLNKLQLLAAMQALSIYIITRLDQGVTDYNNLDARLIATVTALAMQFNSVAPRGIYESNHDAGTGWRDWIYEESRRRLVFHPNLRGRRIDRIKGCA